MTVRQQWAVVGGVVAVLAVGLFAATRIFGKELFPVTVGSKAPDFAATAIDGADAGKVKTIANYEGDVVLLNIWATWCAPCRVEMPSMQEAHDRFSARGLKVVAVSVDVEAGSEEIRRFRDEYKLTFEILHDPSGKIKQAYQTTGVPETFIIGRDGSIRKKVIGAANWDSPANQALIAQLLGVPQSAGGAGRDVADTARVPVRP